MVGEDVGDEPAPHHREGHCLITAIILAARALHEAPAEQIAHDHRGVGVAAEELLPEVALAHRAQVEEDVQRGELAERQLLQREVAVGPRRDRLRGADELEVGIERARFVRGAGVACHQDPSPEARQRAT